MAKLKLPFELEKPSSNEYVTQSSQIGYGKGTVKDALDKTEETFNPDANTDALYITDSSGNILAEFSSQGLKVVDVKAKVSGSLVSLVTQLGNKVDKVTGKGLSTNDYTNAEKDKLSSLKTLTDIDEEANTNILYVRDDSGNVIFKIDSDGVHSTAFLCHLNGNIYNILSLINSLGNGVVKVTSQIFTDEEKAIARNNIGALDADSVSESIADTFYVVDSNANIIFKIDDKGIHTTKVTLAELVSEGDFSIIDNAGNIGLRLKTNGEVDLVLSQESLNRIIPELINASTELSAIIPTDLYRVTNMLYHNREYAPKLMAERMQTGEKYVGYASGSPEWLVANKQLSVFSGNYQDVEIGNTLVQDVFTKKTFSLNLHTSKNTVFQDKKLNFLPLGDSITNHNNWHTYLRKLLLMDNVDWQIANNSEAVKYDMQTLGIKRSVSNVAFTYRNKSVDVSYNYNEGRPSWAAATYLRHAEVYTYATVSYNGVSKGMLHVAWRILGLYEKYNTDYNFSRQQKEYIRTTCNGQYPITTSCIDGWVWNCYRDKINLSSVEFSSATSEQKEAMITYLTTTLLDNPTNPFFSKDKVLETKDSNNCYAFDWETYYARYKTHDENGNVLATQGTKATANMHVCIPNVIGICLGTNDEAYNSADTTVNEQDAYKIAELLQQATNAVVIIFANGIPQSRFPEKYGLAGIQAAGNYAVRYQTKNHQLEEICGDWNNQVSKNIFYAPCYYIQTFGNFDDYPLTELYTEENIGSLLTSEDIHPSNSATAQWSYQIYSLMAYLISKDIL
jgi:lysophospholipase L1-like esterase